MLNIVIPMAGKGSRFAESGYILPKPLIEVKGKPMIYRVTENIAPQQEHRFIYLCLKEHMEKYDLEKKLLSLSPENVVVEVEDVTEGAACTALLAEKYISNDDPLMIANSDQYVDIDINEYLRQQDGFDGLIMTMRATDPKWSFIKYDAEGLIREVREKEVISNEATVGIYNFSKGNDFVYYAKQMIEKNIRVNNEFYIAPVYNEMIEAGKRIKYYNIGSENAGMYGLGIPADLKKFLQTTIAERLV